MLLLEWYFYRGIKINSFVVSDNIHDFFFHIINKNLKNFKTFKVQNFFTRGELYSTTQSGVAYYLTECEQIWYSTEVHTISSLLYHPHKKRKNFPFLIISLYTSFSLKKEQNLKISVWFKFQIFIIFVLLCFRKCKPRM